MIDEASNFGMAQRPEWLKALARRRDMRKGVTVDDAGRHDRAPRVRTLMRALIGDAAMGREPVIVRNVSPGGMCIASRTLSPRMGETLEVSLPGQSRLQAQVRWVGKGEFGVLLTDRPLDVARVQRVNRRRNEGLAVTMGRMLRLYRSEVPA